MKVRLIGFDTIQRSLKNISKSIQDAKVDVARSLSREATDMVMSAIARDSITSRRLLPSTISKKGSDTPLIETGDYSRSWRGSFFKRGKYSVTVQMTPQGKEDLMLILEYGTRFMAPIPHVRAITALVYQEARKRLTEGVRDAF